MTTIKYDALCEFVTDALKRAGLDDFSLKWVSHGLCTTSLRGVDSHGVRLLPHYVNSALKGRKNPKPNFKFITKFPTACLLDADDAFGHSAGIAAMDKAIELCDQYGVGIVGVANSSHPGAMASFGLYAAEKGYVSISMTHADSLQLSYNGKQPYFGTNPICFVAPRKDRHPFCLDMATSKVSWNKVLIAKYNNKELDEGWAADEEGRSTTDPNIARSLLSAGDYKGYGLSAMVEIFCSIFTGMKFGHDIPSMYKHPIEEPRKLGQFYLVMKPDLFVSGDDFLNNLAKLSEQVNSMEKAGNEEVMLPGDPEYKTSQIRLKEGIPLDDATVENFQRLASEYDITLKLK